MSILAGYVFLGLTIICTVAAQVSYKLYFRRLDRRLLAWTMLFFVAVPLCSYMALRVIPLDDVYVSTALTIAMATVGSLWLLGESLERRQWLGIVLLIAGVVVYNL
jgi:multidrug transporter EmrE-like cation transporter